MAWTVIIAKPAQKQAAKFPAKDRAKLGSAVSSMADDPFSGDVLKLAGEDNFWRRRVGSYRQFFAVDRGLKTVAINAIVRRTLRPTDSGPRGRVRKITLDTLCYNGCRWF